VFTSYGPAQTPQLHPRSHEEREEAFRAAHRAILNVKVTDANGSSVIGLAASDFSLIDNGHLRALTSVRYIEHGTLIASPRVILLLDVLNQSTHEFAEDVAGVRKFLTHGDGPLSAPTSVALLSGSGISLGDASQDRNDVLTQLNEMTRGVRAARCEDLTDVPIVYSEIWTNRSAIQTIRDQAPVCLNAKFTLSVTSLEHLAVKEIDTPGRVVLVWIGPGWPRLDGKQFVPDTPEIKENFFEHLVALTTAMREGQVTLDSVTNLHRREFPQLRDGISTGVMKAEDASATSLSLMELVSQSGGQAQDDTQGIPAAVARCVQDAESFYALSFNFSASPSLHEFHAIEVHVNRPGLVARTNTLYYAEP
jgi:hypothetical protein